MNDDFRLAIVVICAVFILILLVSAVITGVIYLVLVYIGHVEVGKTFLILLSIGILLLTGYTIVREINKS